MLSDEEKKALEQARSNITRGNDIESAMLILEKCALDGVIFTGGRLNIFKIAVRQILNFLKEYKDKGYLDVVREKVKANETVKKQSKEIEELSDKLTEKICKGVEEEILEEYRQTIISKNKEIEELKDKNKFYNTAYNLGKTYSNKKWEDKIKVKIEEWQKEKEFYNKDADREWGQYNNWDWVDTIINEMQSLLKKE
jgi:hypothetical protein